MYVSSIEFLSRTYSHLYLFASSFKITNFQAVNKMVELEFHNFDVYYLPLALEKRNTGG